MSGFTTGNKELSQGTFTTSLTLANVSATAITVQPLIDFSGKKKANSVHLSPITLGAHEIQTVDVTAALAKQGITEFLDTDGLELEYSGAPGVLIAQCKSVSDSSDVMMDTPMKDPHSGWGPGSGSHPWRIEGGYYSTLYLKNLTDKPSSAVVQVSYKPGVYLPNTFSLKPHQTIAVNLNQLSTQRAKDINGNRFSVNAKQGRVKWVEIVSGSLVGRVAMWTSDRSLHF